MSVRNSFAFLDDSDDDEPRKQVKAKAKAKPSAAPSPTPAPARNYNRGPRRDGDRRDNRGRRGGEYNQNAGDGNSRKYRRDDRRTDRRRDAERRDRRREGGNTGNDRRGRNQYEKAHQKRGPKKGGHGGWGTDKDAVDIAEETASAAADTPTPTAEDTEEAPPAEPAAPAVTELTLEEHEAAEKERRAKFNERWGSKTTASASADLEKDFTGMSVVGKKTRKLQTETWASARKTNAKSSSKSAQKAKQLKQAIFAEPKHDRGYRDDRGRGRGRGGSDNRGSGGRGGRRYGNVNTDGGRRYGNVNTQDADEFPALA